MSRRSMLVFLLCLTLVGTLAARHGQRTVAQEEGSPAATATTPPTPTPIPTPTAYPLRALTFGLLADMELEAATNGPAVVRAATITIAPGQTSLPFTNEGTTIVAVTNGMIVVESDQASVQAVDSAALVGLRTIAGTPGPIDGETVAAGWQIVLADGSTTVIRNTSASPAVVIVLALLPTAAASASPVP